MAHYTRFDYYNDTTPWCRGQDAFAFNNTISGAGVWSTNTKTTTVLSDVFAYFWFPFSNLTWSAAPSGNSGCWSVPTYDGTSSGGYFRYRSACACSITEVNGTTTLQTYSWRSQCAQGLSSTGYQVRRQAYGTVNGTQQSSDAWITLVPNG